MHTFFSRPSRIVAASAGAVLASLLMAGCHEDTTPATTVVTTPSAPAAAAPSVTTAPGSAATSTAPDTKINTNAGAGASTGTDTALADAVNTAIVHNKQMTGSRVEPVADAGVVTLNGQVQNQQQKALAEKSASQVPGVASIKNKLIIVTTGGAKPKPTVITKTKTIVVHDQAVPPTSSTGGTEVSPPPAAPDTAATPAPPAAPDSAGAGSAGTGNP